MRLNRNSAIFIALLAVVIVVALIFLQDDEGSDNEPAVEATAETVQLFSGVSEATVNSLSVTGIVTPAESDATPEADAQATETSSETIALSKDPDSGTWSVDDSTTQTIDGTISSSQIDTAVQALVSLRSNRQFTPSDGDYAQFGLDEPSFDISFTGQPSAEDGVAGQDSTETATFRLRTGNRTVGENSYYAFLNDDDETIYVVTNATTLQNSILNLATDVPLEPTPVPTVAPVLNPQAPFAEFVLTNASNFTFTDNNGDTLITVTRNADNTEWIYTQNGEELPVQQESLQVILNNFSLISGIDQVDTDDLASLGLDSPQYILAAQTVGGRVFNLQLGGQDPTGSLYYGLVNDFDSIVLIGADSVASLVNLFTTPPPLLEIEATPEITAEPESTESAD